MKTISDIIGELQQPGKREKVTSIYYDEIVEIEASLCNRIAELEKQVAVAKEFIENRSIEND